MFQNLFFKKIFVFFLVVQLAIPPYAYAGWNPIKSLTDTIGGLVGGALGIDSYVGKAVEGMAADVQNGAEAFVTNKLGISSDDMRIGVATHKLNIPSVSLEVVDTSSKNFTVFANVTGIKNYQDAYYTWYLLNDNGYRDAKTCPAGECYPRADYVELADEAAEAKKNAMRAYIDVHFDPIRYDSPFNGGDDDGILNEYLDPATLPTSELGEDGTDGDGALAFVGGANAYNGVALDDGVDGYEGVEGWPADYDNYCYIYEEATGDDYEIVAGDDVDTGITCDEDEEHDWDGVDPRWDLRCLYSRTFEGDCKVPTAGEIASFIENEFTESTGGTGTGGTSTGGDASGGGVGTDGTVTGGTATGGTGAGGAGAGGDALTSSISHFISENRPAYEQGLNLTQCSFNEEFGCRPGDSEDAAPEPFCTNGMPVCIPIEELPEFEARDTNSRECADRTTLLLLVTYDYLSTLIDTLTAQLGACNEGCSERPDGAVAPCRRQCENTIGPQIASAEAERAEVRALIPDEDFDRIEEILRGLELGTDPDSFECISNGTIDLWDCGICYDTTVVLGESGNHPVICSGGAGECAGRDTTTGCADCTLAGFRTTEVDQINPYLVEDGYEAATCLEAPTNVPDPRSGDIYEHEDLEYLCTEEIHLFPGGPGQEAYEEVGVATGNGDFDQGEEEFWGMNPASGQTIKTMGDDETVIMGQGLSTFTWEYKPGDRIGVVVEGTGIDPTKHDNPRPRTVFAFMQGGCSPQDVGFYYETVRGDDIFFQTVDMDREDLDECALANLIDPSAVRENKNLVVEILGPEEPVVNGQGFYLYFDADVSSEQGEYMESPDRVKNAQYDWRFYRFEGEADGYDKYDPGNVWEPFFQHDDLLGDLEFDGEHIADALDINALRGFGIQKLRMRANFPGIPEEGGLFKAVVNVNAASDQAGETYFGQGEFVFTILPAEDEAIEIYPVETYSPADGRISRADLRDEQICDGGGDAANENVNFHICTTIKNEVLGVQLNLEPFLEVFPDLNPELVQWRVNGRSYSCDPGLYTDCAEESIIFIAPENEGQVYTVSATIADPGAGRLYGREFSRTIYVVDPEMILTPCAVGPGTEGDADAVTDLCTETTNGLTPIQLGEYLAPTVHDDSFGDGVTVDDAREDAFVRSGATFGLNARLTPDMLNYHMDEAGTEEVTDEMADRVTVVWEMANGDEIPAVGPSASFTVPEHLAEAPVEVGARAIIKTPDPIRALLYKHFGIDQFESTPQVAVGSAYVKPPEAIPEAFLSKEQYLAIQQERIREKQEGTFLAFLGTHTPAYILTLIRLIVVGGGFLLITSFLMRGARRFE